MFVAMAITRHVIDDGVVGMTRVAGSRINFVLAFPVESAEGISLQSMLLTAVLEKVWKGDWPIGLNGCAPLNGFQSKSKA